jgi:hypothetical protein
MVRSEEFLPANAAQNAIERGYLRKARITHWKRRNIGKRKMTDTAVGRE